MKKLFVALFLLTLSATARENPFFPITGEADIPLTTNKVVTIAPLKRAAISLPSTARTLQKITLSYKNLDGSLAKKSIVLQNSIDWHIPIFISQNINEREEKAQTKQRKTSKFKKIADFRVLLVYTTNQQLKLVTKNRMIRHFLLTDPHRVVCDFKSKTDMHSYVKKIKGDSKVKEVRFGNHKGYYRIVLTLDGLYRYKTQAIPEGYIITLL